MKAYKRISLYLYKFERFLILNEYIQQIDGVSVRCGVGPGLHHQRTLKEEVRCTFQVNVFYLSL